MIPHTDDDERYRCTVYTVTVLLRRCLKSTRWCVVFFLGLGVIWHVTVCYYCTNKKMYYTVPNVYRMAAVVDAAMSNGSTGS